MVSQNPSGGTAPPGSTVTITVSGGAVPVPSVVGDSQQTASQILTTAGFAVSVQPGSGPAQYANGTVFSQQPAATSTAAKGSTVTIFVQNGASPSPSPSPTPSSSPSASPTVRLRLRAIAAGSAPSCDPSGYAWVRIAVLARDIPELRMVW